jgi:hypothetical protein
MSALTRKYQKENDVLKGKITRLELKQDPELNSAEFGCP